MKTQSPKKSKIELEEENQTLKERIRTLEIEKSDLRFIVKSKKNFCCACHKKFEEDDLTFCSKCPGKICLACKNYLNLWIECKFCKKTICNDCISFIACEESCFDCGYRMYKGLDKAYVAVFCLKNRNDGNVFSLLPKDILFVILGQFSYSDWYKKK